MKQLQLGLVIACGTFAGAGCGCAPEMEGSTVSQLTQRDSVEAATNDEVATNDPEIGGAAGHAADAPEPSTEGAINALEGSELAGVVTFAPGSAWSGEIDVFCCREGSYSVYVYEGGRCSDPDSWDVEQSARVADLACSNDVGAAAYVRDPSQASAAAFVIYDAAGDAAGCADVETE
jgi:hypothetical protein